MKNSLQFKLFLSMAFISLIGIIVMSVLFSMSLSDNLNRQLKEQASGIANAINIGEKNSRRSEQAIEDVMGQRMVTEAKLIAELLQVREMNVTDIKELAKKVNVDEIYVTDKDGVVVLSNNESTIGWKFPDDGSQAAEFRRILSDPSRVIVQKAMERDFDHQFFKFAGVARKDQPGIVQVGVNAATIKNLIGKIGQASFLTNLVGTIDHAAVIDKQGELVTGVGKIKDIGNSTLIKSAQKDDTVKSAIVSIDNKSSYQTAIPRDDGSVLVIGTDYGTIKQTIKKARLNLVYTALIILLLCSFIAYLLSKRITRPIAQLSELSESIADGNLAGRVEIKQSNDEIGHLAGSYTQMLHNLRKMIGDVQQNSEKVASHSQELASSGEEVSATVEEVAGTTNEVAATSARGAENAKIAAEESNQVMEVAEEGNKAVQEAVQKMSSIDRASQNASTAVQKLGEQSAKIEDIISTITTIADQTNLLALNAAIEAARAGEHGKGFAVVAEEVRKLAEQSANAANQITDLVKEIQSGVGEAISAMENGASEVKEGVEIAHNAGASLKQIRKAVEKNTSMIQDIAGGMKQSSEGIQQLSTSNEQITSTVQQVSTSAQELSTIAEELQNTVAQFKIEDPD